MSYEGKTHLGVIVILAAESVCWFRAVRWPIGKHGFAVIKMQKHISLTDRRSGGSRDSGYDTVYSLYDGGGKCVLFNQNRSYCCPSDTRFTDCLLGTRERLHTRFWKGWTTWVVITGRILGATEPLTVVRLVPVRLNPRGVKLKERGIWIYSTRRAWSSSGGNFVENSRKISGHHH